MDVKRRKTEDFADKSASCVTDPGKGVTESKAITLKADLVEFNVEARKSDLFGGSELPVSSAIMSQLPEKGKNSLRRFLENRRLRLHQHKQRCLCPPGNNPRSIEARVEGRNLINQFWGPMVYGMDRRNLINLNSDSMEHRMEGREFSFQKQQKPWVHLPQNNPGTIQIQGVSADINIFCRYDHMRVNELNRKKDIVCLILSYPVNSVNKEKHRNWVWDVLKINHEVREMETFSSKRKMSLSELSSAIATLLDHSIDDIEAYVPPMIIEKMCKKALQVDIPINAVFGQRSLESPKQEFGMTAEVAMHDEKVLNLAVDFAIRQILQDIENLEVLTIRISGRYGTRVTSTLTNLPQIRKLFNVVVKVDATSCSNSRDIEESIAIQLGFATQLFSTLNISEVDRFLEDTSFLILLDDIHERIDLYEVGTKWWNSKNIQKIVYTTRSREVHQRKAVDLEIRLEDHLLSWELFCMNVGKIVRSSGFQHRATDVVGKCSGHLLAVVLMAKALKMVVDISIWEHASYILGLPHGSQMKDRVLFNALAFILGCSGSADKCVKYCAFYLKREGADKVNLIMEWIRHGLIDTFDEGEKTVRNLVGAFLLESFQNGYSVRMRDEIREVLVDLFRLKINAQFLSLGGKGLTKAPKDEAWEEASEIHLMNNKLRELPKSPNCSKLYTLFLQNNLSLRVIPPSFFQHMPMLQILDLSHTKIRFLPQSLYGLTQLQRFFLRGCKLFMELPPEVGKLCNLKVLDLEGTEIIRLPVDVGRLTNLTCLKMSFYEDDNNRKDNQSNAIIPQNVISNLFQLEELTIDVSPNDKRWNASVKAIVEEVCSLKRLEALRLYLPEVLILNDLRSASSSINLSGMHFRFTVGSHLKRIISRLPLQAVIKFEEEERCLQYVNDVGIPTVTKKVLQHATAFFLDRHLTITHLSEFGFENMENLKVCILGECNEMRTIIDADDDEVVFGSLEYLNLHYMRNLRSIWKGPSVCGSLSNLKAVALNSCPQLTTIFPLNLLGNLCNLEELVVEDCPEINSLVTHDFPAEDLPWWIYLPKLKKISLHYLPKLVSISSGLRIAPNLEWMSVYGCPSLRTLSPEEGKLYTLKVIIGEADWWSALRWEKSERFQLPSLDCIFVPIEMDKDLMTQLTEFNDQL